MMTNELLRKRSGWTGVILAALLLCGVSFTGCTVDKTEEGNLPEYEVTQTEEGNLPEYDVDAADVEVGTETREVEVPTVDVQPADEDDDDDADDAPPPAP